MRPINIDQAGAGTSAWVPLDVYQRPFNVSLALEVVSGAINATVQYTMDNIWDPTVVPNAVNHADLTAKTAYTDGTLISTVMAVRLVNADVGTARLRIIQAGAV